jgi:hypothetical protein
MTKYRLLAYLDDDTIAVDIDGVLFNSNQVLVALPQGIRTLKELWGSYYKTNDVKSTCDIILDVLDRGYVLMEQDKNNSIVGIIKETRL